MKIDALAFPVILGGVSLIFFGFSNIYFDHLHNKMQTISNFDFFKNRSNFITNIKTYADNNLGVTTTNNKVVDEEQHLRSKQKKIDGNNVNHSFRILHVITSIEQYDDGERGTKYKYDRLKNILIPALKQTTETVSKVPNWTIDIYLILGYNISSTPARKQMILDALPQGVGVEIWDRATPYYGAVSGEESRDSIRELHHALSRQHRLVVKDKYDYYDFFSCWEDDVIITSHHFQTYLRMSNEIVRLTKLAPRGNPGSNKSDYSSSLFKQELMFLVPGFLRVEVLSQPEKVLRALSNGNHNVPVNKTIKKNGIDPRPCCNISKDKSSSIALWETNITGMGLLHMRNSSLLNWIALLPCRLNNRFKVFSHKRSTESSDPKLFAQQAGWMLTKTQLQLIDRRCAQGGFLPPYNKPHWLDDALGNAQQQVEFWSGGYHLFYRCGVQRILSLDVDVFSNQLIFHSSNNKQIQLPNERFMRANDLLGQLHTLKMRAVSQS